MNIFVVEDDEWYNKLLIHTISLNPDFNVKGFTSAAELKKHLHEKPDAITLDYRLPDESGMDVLNYLQANYPDIQCIMISEQEDIEVVVDVLKNGAYDYLVKSNDIRDKLLNTLQHIGEKNKLKSELNSLKKEVQQKYSFQNHIKGKSPAMKAVYSLMEKAMKTNITISIYGETGTGKEVVAKAIHYNSPKRKEPFVAVNVAAIPKELMESELFGHEKGAFTGAQNRRIGKFEEAGNGTLFLDEIGDMEEALQAKLLRALQEREVVRVGANKTIKIACRIVVATHKKLEDLVNQGKFREDLYYRLLGLSINLPPLRQRENDIMLLAKHFLHVFCQENQLPEKSFTEEAVQKIMNHSFPGNVRELKSVIELAATLSSEPEIQANDIQLRSQLNQKNLFDEELTLKAYNLKILHHFLDKYQHNVSHVAKILGIGKATVYRMLKE